MVIAPTHGRGPLLIPLGVCHRLIGRRELKRRATSFADFASYPQGFLSQMDFNAGTIVMGEELDNLVREGHTLIPMQWIETDKHEHLRETNIRKNEKHIPKYKSRLVACGNLENCPDVRTDSPTTAVEGLNLLCSWAASKRLKMYCADISNAYFN